MLYFYFIIFRLQFDPKRVADSGGGKCATSYLGPVNLMQTRNQDATRESGWSAVQDSIEHVFAFPSSATFLLAFRCPQ